MKTRIVKFAVFACLFWISVAILPLFSKLNLKETSASPGTLSSREQNVSACAVLESGFGDVESWGVWTVAKTSVLSLVLPSVPKKLLLNFKAQGFGKLRHVEIFHEAQKIGFWLIKKHSPENYILDCSKLPRKKRIKLTFINNELSRPCDLIKGNNDRRSLGIGFRSIQIAEASKAQK